MTSVQKRRGRSGICFRGPAPAITEVVAVVKLARIADGWLDRAGPAKEVAQRAGVLACSAGGGAQVGRSVGIGARPSYRSDLLFRQGVPPHATYLFKHPWYRTPRATVLRRTVGASNVLVCPDKIACHWV